MTNLFLGSKIGKCSQFRKDDFFMSERSTYKTKQRERLIAYLKTVKGTHITAADVCKFFKDQDSSIGQSTIYRQLEKLVDEGLLKKYIVDSNSPACFEYVEADSHVGESVCFHCKCEKCGSLIHLHCDTLEGIESHLYEEHNFKINTARTVFYGLCSKCSTSA